ncbi:LPS export ABC transporter permease LptG [Brevirhabdus pacifica]|uniref:LPS export ABC transporter permease LptG n=1 Tax=Brevirhabdus pacifica TaxID=1267768 RepID=A0A1U7DL82_9RHOB|nr:LPS export ABC transporter permease LptG [Brevirhabdus pacifica]APX90754.1 LPS export ABC transporter permease LptG [Brevirhabdus pacifica]OWU79542.1 permease [Loktanella sp. 22II-4b]PJJ87369.1 lipopolysaccharide export system permease protein [Brevirhabdus pacifica]
MILHLYFMRKFLKNFLIVLAVFVAITVLADMVEQIRRFESDAVGLGEALQLALLNTPANLYRILPLLVILSTLSLFLGLARTSELVVTRAAGRSALRSLAAPVIAALGLGIFAVAVINPIVAGTLKQSELIADRFANGNASVLSISREGLWLRQGNAEGQTVIHAQRANLDGTEMIGVSFLAFGRDAGPLYRVEAQRAELTEGAWNVIDGKRWEFPDVENPEAQARRFETLRIPSDLTRDAIRESFGTPSGIPIWQLPEFIERMEKAGFSARQHRVWFWMEMAHPLLLVAMVLIAAGFTMRHTRFGRTGVMLLMALLLGFGIFFLKNFAQILGENGQIPVLLAAWAPPVAGIMLSLGLLFHTEDG